MDAEAILTAFAEGGAEVIIIGGVGAVLQGALMTTGDLDLVHLRSPENTRRLVGVLRKLEACYQDELPRRVEPTEADLASPLHHLLQTRFGRLDLLGTVVRGLEYADLLPRTRELPLEGERLVRVLDLPALIELKELTGRPKDQAHLPLLRAVLAEQRKRAGESGNTGER
jgi:hypothetical protein